MRPFAGLFVLLSIASAPAQAPPDPRVARLVTDLVGMLDSGRMLGLIAQAFSPNVNRTEAIRALVKAKAPEGEAALNRALTTGSVLDRADAFVRLRDLIEPVEGR